ncbi:gamma-glutamyl-gamma-aminobutyrate hydrolase family protein [Pelomonas sp. KK5]|uniref:gamma-glutamyl-gamma-aminobutyrate hydrolase family protein n=1 Tax=Pelomonas sp. KK5 TaxID=1855730 RepID=UPI001E4751FD|nr:gamma-glutamyl-gamma-aminobutyrate hydrolase family protein [Pelomonas sp. KK5]
MTTTMMKKPRVLVPACNRPFGEHPFHMVGRKYIDAVRLAGGLPVVVPSAPPEEVDEWLDQADGVLLTGSRSNVHPSHFGEAVLDASQPLDPERDAWTLPLVRKALARGLPLLGICRGFQEANVALGGDLHQAVQEQPGLQDHREQDGEPTEAQYAARHEVRVSPGGCLEAVLGRESFRVNSLHGQGIRRLAPGLRVEATAPDGLVEAFSAAGPGFALFVQWHPEWQAAGNPVSMALLRAFGQACADYRDLVRDAACDPEI